MDNYRESDDTTLWTVAKQAMVTAALLLTIWSAVVLGLIEFTS